MIPPAEGIPKARAAADRAITLDPDLVDAYVVRVHIEMDHDKNFAAATRDLARARQLGGNSALFWHYSAMWNGQQGRLEEALADMRRARRLEPMTGLLASNYAFILFNARRYDETIQLLTPLVAANPGFDHARSVLARALTATGDFPGALAQLQARSGPYANQGELGVLYAKMGRREEALLEIERLESLEKHGFAEEYEMATIYTTLGELDEACVRLQRALEDHSLLINWMRTDPRLDALRGRQCFAAVEKQLYGQ
jgi:serine/threonine-protein kinase